MIPECAGIALTPVQRMTRRRAPASRSAAHRNPALPVRPRPRHLGGFQCNHRHTIVDDELQGHGPHSRRLVRFSRHFSTVKSDIM